MNTTNTPIKWLTKEAGVSQLKRLNKGEDAKLDTEIDKNKPHLTKQKQLIEEKKNLGQKIVGLHSKKGSITTEKTTDEQLLTELKNPANRKKGENFAKTVAPQKWADLESFLKTRGQSDNRYHFNYQNSSEQLSGQINFAGGAEFIFFRFIKEVSEINNFASIVDTDTTLNQKSPAKLKGWFNTIQSAGQKLAPLWAGDKLVKDGNPNNTDESNRIYNYIFAAEKLTDPELKDLFTAVNSLFDALLPATEINEAHPYFAKFTKSDGSSGSKGWDTKDKFFVAWASDEPSRLSTATSAIVPAADYDKSKWYNAPKEKNRTFDVEDGLKGWFKLFHSVFPDSTARKRFQEDCETDPHFWEVALITHGADFNGSSGSAHSYKLTTRKDEDGKEITYITTDNGDDVIKSVERDKNLAESEIVRIDKEIEATNKLIDANEKAIVECRKKIDESGIAKVMRAVVVKRRAKLVEDNFEDTNFDWTKTENETKILAAMQNLIAIRYLENDGSMSAPDFKVMAVSDDEKADEVAAVKLEDKVWKAIKVEWDKSDQRLINAAINWFESKDGATVEDKVREAEKENTDSYDSIGLEVVMMAYQAKGQVGKAWEIELALQKIGKIDDQGETPDQWRTALKEVDPQLENLAASFILKWMDSSKTKDLNKKDKAKAFLLSVKNATATAGEEYKDFFEQIKVKSASYPDTENIEDWSNLMKQEPEVVIKAIARYQYEKLSDDEGTANSKVQIRRQIAKNLGKSSAEELTDEELNNNLCLDATGSKKLDRTKKYDQKLNEISSGNGGDGKKGSWFAWDGGWRNYVTYGGITTLIVGTVLAVIYWQNIVDWWNGPTEEEIEKDED